MNILRALFLNNSNKEDIASTTESTKTTTNQSIEFMSKFNLRILCWELRINYHNNQQTASALPSPIQKWLKQQQEQFPHADWMVDQVEKSILDEIKDSPAAIKKLVSKAAEQKEKNQPTAAVTPAQAQVPADVDSIHRCLQSKSARNCPAGYSYPLAQDEKSPFHNFDNLKFNKKQILRVFGMEDDASPSGSGSSFDEGNITPSNGFSGRPRDWDEVIVAEEEEGDAPLIAHNAANRLIPPLAQTGVPSIAAAAAMVYPQPQEMRVSPAHPQYVAVNGQYPAQLVNSNKNNGSIWQPLHGLPIGQSHQQYIPLIYTPHVQKQQQAQGKPFPGPTGEGFRIPNGHTPQQLQPHATPQRLQYQQQQGHYIHPHDGQQHQWAPHYIHPHGGQLYQQTPHYYQPAVANQSRPENKQEMERRLQKFYNGYYKNHYQKQLRAYQLKCQQQQQPQYQPQQVQPRQQQIPAPRRPQLLVEQQQQEEKEAQENTAYVSAQVIDMGGAESASKSIHQVDRLSTDWLARYTKDVADFSIAIAPRLVNKFTLGAASAKLECINTIGNGVNGDIHVVRYFQEPPAPAPKPIQYIMKRVRFANRVKCKETQVEGKKIALHLGAEEEVFGLTLNHPNLMKLYHVFLNEDNLNLEIIMPRMTASLSKLNTVLGQEAAFPYREERYAWYIMHEFLQGLAYLHANGRFHGDIKPANVLVSEIGEIKLTDFGLCGRTDEVYRQLRGTPLYLAPEVAATEFDSNAKYGYKSDMYSAGIMMYEFLMGDPVSEGCPFDYEGLQSEQGWRWLATRVPTIKDTASSQYKALLALLLHRDPNQRPSPFVLLNSFEFFSEFQFMQKLEAERREFSKLVRIYTSVEVMNQV
ncbi:conserved hypothetical protein [Mucor ambiguus]|uniref:non-specific serine/threonine protein kinase n=1 Tax=Mucor ambiguus TaxID=91626 RepID=A0A0C9LY99_9FUNG|nr:conserved hypothetical protein [Mucor ambiguus]